jgi:segregation and condensation protein B
MTPEKMQAIIEAAIMVAGHPLTIAAMQNLFTEEEKPSTSDIKSILTAIKQRYEEGGLELREVASGYRFQAKAEYSSWLARLWEERAARYSRAFMETLALIAYRQPITRAEIEEIRGVTVSTNIMKTLSEREWIRVIGYRDVPGKPAIYGTTREFLDYFNLKSLAELPTLAEFKDLKAQEEQLQVQLALESSHIGPDNSEVIPEERDAIIADDSHAPHIIQLNESAVEEANEQDAEAEQTDEAVA